MDCGEGEREGERGVVVGSISERERPAMGIKCKWGAPACRTFQQPAVQRAANKRTYIEALGTVQCTYVQYTSIKYCSMFENTRMYLTSYSQFTIDMLCHFADNL